MDKSKLSKAINEVYEELAAMSRDDFLREIYKHEDGDITMFLRETDALNASDYKAQLYGDDQNTYAAVSPSSAELAFTIHSRKLPLLPIGAQYHDITELAISIPGDMSTHAANNLIIFCEEECLKQAA